MFLSIMARTHHRRESRRCLEGPPRDRASDAQLAAPAAVRQGVTVATPGRSVTPGQRELCGELLRAIGALVEWVDQEALLDPVTAVVPEAGRRTSSCWPN